MENPYDPNERGSSYELSERRPSNGLPSVESAQINSSNNPLLKAASADPLRRRLKGRHVQMYVHHSASFPLLYSCISYDRIAASSRSSSCQTSLTSCFPDCWHNGHRTILRLRGSHKARRASWSPDGICSCWVRGICVCGII